MKKNLGLIISCIVLIILVILIYFPITKTFYQQDEWLGYGMYLTNGLKMIFQNTSGFLGMILGEGRILTNLLYFLFYKYFPLNIFPVAVFAIFFHIINVLIVFFLAQNLFKKTLLAFFSSLFFGVNSVSQSAIIWPAASINALPSTTLILLSLYFFFKYIENLKNKWLIICFLLIYLSLFFKETGIFLLIFLPIFAPFFNKYSFKNYIKTFWFYFLTAGIIICFRLFGFISIPHTYALFLTGSSKYFIDSLVIRSILYPITSFSLTYIPAEPMVWFARYIENVYYPFFMPQEFILIAQTVIVDFMAFIFSFVLLTLVIIMMKYSNKIERKTVIFFIAFTFISFLPYIIISKSYSYLESRYFYVPTFSAAIILGWLLDKILVKARYKIIKFILVVSYILFIGIHVKYLKNDISSQVLVAKERQSFLSQLSQQVPTISKDKNVFFITSDSNYYIEGNKVPFQQGFGYTLESLYYGSHKIPEAFLNSGYLFDIGSQGYRETEGKGFGYFYDLASLRTAVKENHLDKKSIIAFKYDNLKQTLINITPEIQRQLP